MKKLLILSGFIFLFHFILQASDGEYSVSKISFSLLKKANAVLRLEEQRFEIKSTSEAVFINHYVITILNENGEDRKSVV